MNTALTHTDKRVYIQANAHIDTTNGKQTFHFKLTFEHKGKRHIISSIWPSQIVHFILVPLK